MKQRATTILSVLMIFSLAIGVTALVKNQDGMVSSSAITSAEDSMKAAISSLNNTVNQLHETTERLVDRLDHTHSPNEVTTLDDGFKQRMLDELARLVEVEIDVERNVGEYTVAVDPGDLTGAPKVSSRGDLLSGPKGARATLPKMLIANPTLEQNRIFEELKSRMDDPDFTQSLSLADLTSMEEVQALPELLQKVIISKAVQKYNQGEINEETFLQGMPTSQN